jgi:hypothetical protein
LRLLLELLNLVDLLVELGDLLVQEAVAALLIVDALREQAVDQDHQQDAEPGNDSRHRQELALLRLAPLGAMRE